jgi:hypothetical protein
MPQSNIGLILKIQTFDMGFSAETTYNSETETYVP